MENWDSPAFAAKEQETGRNLRLFEIVRKVFHCRALA